MSENSKADPVADYISFEIQQGNWKPGDRLPTERDLAKHFQLSRNTIRKSLDSLEAAGMLYRHVGRGTFISSHGLEQGERTRQPAMTTNSMVRSSAVQVPAIDDADGLSPADVIECRMLLEPSFAHLVTARATLADMDRIAYYYERCESAGDVYEFEKWDEAFHDAIAVASHNQSIVMLTRNLAKVRQREDWLQLKSLHFDATRKQSLQQQHLTIVESIRCRDAHKTREALKAHLSGIQHNLFDDI